MPVTVKGLATIDVTTQRLKALFEGPRLVSLLGPGGEVLLERPAESGPPGLEVVFADAKPVPLGSQPSCTCRAIQVGANVAHLHVQDDEADACLRIEADPDGRLVLEHSAQTLRPGLGAVRLNLAGIEQSLKLVAPFFQGCRQDLEHPLVAGRWTWPCSWEAALAILQGARGGWSVRCSDLRHVPKALVVGHADQPRTLGLDTEAIGPWDRNTAAGSLQWIIDTHRGPWDVPARQYHDWLWDFQGLGRLAPLRPQWAKDIRFTVQWCPCRPDILDELAKALDPRRVLLHVPGWRSDPYDVNYPQYAPSPEGRAFIAKADAMGFRVLPHFNYFTIDPNHPFFQTVREFVMRDVFTKRLLGWRWDGKGCPPFPQAIGNLGVHRDQKVMTYLHAGSSAWRRELAGRIAQAVGELKTPGLFVDQTLCTWNVDNGLVENLSATEGMVALTRELTALDGAPAVCGEGRNEMCMRYETFAQAHLYYSWHTNHPKFAELDPVPVGEALYGDLCRTMGYALLDGAGPDSRLRMEVHRKLGAIGSVTIRDADQIANPSPAVRELLEAAQ